VLGGARHISGSTLLLQQTPCESPGELVDVADPQIRGQAVGRRHHCLPHFVRGQAELARRPHHPGQGMRRLVLELHKTIRTISR
jgi:hypothetical protein